MGSEARAGTAADVVDSERGWMLRAALPLLLFAAVIALPFYRVWGRWTAAEGYFTHGPLIPFVCMYLVLRKRKELTGKAPPEVGELYAFGIAAAVLYFVFADFEWDKRWLFAILCTVSLGYVVYHLRHLKPEPWKPGLYVMVPGLLLCVFTSVHGIISVGWFFSVVLTCGLVLYFLGKRISKVLWFPLLFLFTTVPLPEYIITRVTLPLQMFATGNTVQILRSPVVGIYCQHQGTKIIFPARERDLSALESGGQRQPLTKEVTVGAVCSGLRSLIALIAFGMLFAYITPLSKVKKLILLAATIPASFIANLFRILALALVTYWWDAGLATGSELWDRMEQTFLSSFVPHLRKISNEPIHDFTGIMIFVVAFVALFSLERLLAYIEYRQKLAAEKAGIETDDAPEDLDE